MSKMFDSRQESCGAHKSVLNQPCPLNTVTPPPVSNDLEISVNTPTAREVEDTIRSLKNGKATGIDAIHAEILKVDLPTSVGVFCPFFNEVWEREEIHWRKGLIVKITKKGDISVCDNSRGITLVSIPSKLFCWIFLNRIRMAVDQRIREEQAGFRARRGCSSRCKQGWDRDVCSLLCFFSFSSTTS